MVHNCKLDFHFLQMTPLLVAALVVTVSAEQRCTLTEKMPQRLDAPLSFCSMFTRDSCCDPTIDSEIAGYYTDLVGVSDLCAAETSDAHIYLKYWFCFGCNPHQMTYVNETSSTITVCPNFVKKVDPVEFDGCGLRRPGERGDICAGDGMVSDCFQIGC